MGRRQAGSHHLALSPFAPVSGAMKPVQTDPSMDKVASTEVCRRQPRIPKESSRTSARFAEVAGGKMAECAAICCCCPCGIIGLVILAVVRLPACLCRRALRKRWRSRKKAKLLGSSSGMSSNSGAGSGSSTGGGHGSHGGCSANIGSAFDDKFTEFSGLRGTIVMVVGESWPVMSPSAEVMKHEEEVWSKFYSSGFWRSPSQKDNH